MTSTRSFVSDQRVAGRARFAVIWETQDAYAPKAAVAPKTGKEGTMSNSIGIFYAPRVGSYGGRA